MPDLGYEVASVLLTLAWLGGLWAVCSKWDEWRRGGRDRD